MVGSCGAALHVKKLVTPEFATGLRRGCKGKGTKARGSPIPRFPLVKSQRFGRDAEQFYAWISLPFGAGTSWRISCERFTF